MLKPMRSNRCHNGPFNGRELALGGCFVNIDLVAVKHERIVLLWHQKEQASTLERAKEETSRRWQDSNLRPRRELISSQSH